jgi:hypothetical protein
MEKTKLLASNKSGTIAKKEKMANKIESLWAESSSPTKNFNQETKKLQIKLETTGKEKSKLVLKMESASSKTHANNYTLISELLKEFFNGN